MDVFIIVTTLVSIISSATVISVSAVVLHKRLTATSRVAAEIREQVKTLGKVLGDVARMLANQPPESDGDGIEALQHVHDECKKRFYLTTELLGTYLYDLRRNNGFFPRILFAARFMVQEADLKSSYHSLRESAILATDLASNLKADLKLDEIDKRTKYQLAQLTGALVILLQEDADAAESLFDGYDHTDPLASNGQSTFEASQSHFHENFFRRGGIRRMARIGRELAELTETNFVTTITLIIEVVSSKERNEVCQKQILTPSKFDTGSDVNLVSYELLHEQGIREDLLIPIPVDKRVELTGVNETFTCTPEWEITLFWWKPTDMKRRRDKFMVVTQAPFGVLFSSKMFTDELVGKSALLSKGRYKPKKEVLNEIRAEEAKRKKALERVEKEYREAEAKKLVPVRRTASSSSAGTWEDV